MQQNLYQWEDIKMKIPELSLLFCLLNDKWVFLRVESNIQRENSPRSI